MKIFQSILKLGSGTAIAQGITFLTLPLISRIYSPTEYGQLMFLLSATGLFVPIATLKIETLIITISSEKKMRDYFKFSILSSSLIAFSISVVFLIFLTISDRNNRVTNITLSMLFCIILFVQSISVLTIQLALRTSKYEKIAQSGIVQSASTSTLQILLGKIDPTVTILVGSFFVGRLLGVLPIVKEPINIYQETKLKARRYILFKSVVKENKYLVPASFLEVANNVLVILFISVFFGYKYSAFVGLAQTLLMVPITLLAGSFGSIVIAEISAINRNDTENNLDKTQFLGKIIWPLTIMFLLYVLFFTTLASLILSILFNNEWIGVKDLIPLLAVPIGINFFWNPFINYLYAEKRWLRILKINLMRILLVGLVSFLCILSDQNWKITAISMFAGGGAFQFFCIVFSFKNISRSYRV
jgi:O-antigen/teichoic acid export membrane protein